MHPLVPCNSEEWLAVSGRHRLYIERSGNPDGLPVVLLHGGPGSHSKPSHRRFFSPQHCHILRFDQRGCGRSTPHGECHENTLDHLIEDLEAIRRHAAIDRWLLCGGSWGATVALRYAQCHPEQVLGLILRGAFLARKMDYQWFYQGGVGRFFPAEWQTLLAPLTAADRDDPPAAYHRLLHQGRPEEQIAAALRWQNWETRVVTASLATSTPDSRQETVFSAQEQAQILREMRLFHHYIAQQFSLPDDRLVKDLPQIPAVPISLIHGRRDMVCLPESAWLLQQALPQAQLQWVEQAGHLAAEPALAAALLRHCDNLVARLLPTL